MDYIFLKESVMDEFILMVVGGFFRLLLFVAVECMYYRIFYYIGAIPVWAITRGRLPTKDPAELPKRDRRWYAVSGIVVCLLVAWAGSAVA